MLAEIVRYRPYDDHVTVVIQVEQVKLYARLTQGKDMNGKPIGYSLWIGDSPTQYPNEQAAIDAACRYAERIVLGVINHGSNEDFVASDQVELDERLAALQARR